MDREKIIEQIERATGKKIGTREDRKVTFEMMPCSRLRDIQNGISRALWNRAMDEDGCFEGEIEGVKTEILKENRDIVESILSSRTCCK